MKWSFRFDFYHSYRYNYTIMNKKIILGIIIFIGLMIYGYFVYLGVTIFTVKRRVVIPPLIGEEFEAAEKLLKKRGIKYEIIENKTLDYPDRTIFFQYPDAGREILKGYRIKLYVAKNDGNTKVPDLTGLDLVNARIVLDKNRLQLREVKHVRSRINLSDKIIHQSKRINSFVEIGTKVDLIINEGTIKNYLLVPYFLNNKYEYVQTTMDPIGLFELKKEKDEGEVISQSLSPGNIVKYGNGIQFSVISSTDVIRDTKPNLINENGKNASRKEFRFFKYSFPSFLGQKSAKIYLYKDGQRIKLFDEIIKGGKIFKKLISFKESAKVKVYLNGKLIEEKKL